MIYIYEQVREIFPNGMRDMCGGEFEAENDSAALSYALVHLPGIETLWNKEKPEVLLLGSD